MDGHAPSSKEVGVVHQDNSVVDDDSHQYNQTDGGKEAEVGACCDVEHDHTDHRQRDGKKDDKGVQKGLELAGHHTENEEDRYDQYVDESPPVFLEVFKVAAVGDDQLVIGRYVLPDQLLDFGHDDVDRLSLGQPGGDRHRPALVLSVNADRAGCPADFGNTRQGDTLSELAVDEYLLEVGYLVSAPFFQ